MPVLPPLPGVVVDASYRLDARIGGGGMCDVFLAAELATGRAVAVKLLHPELAEDAELGQRFFQEARAISRIAHPNVVEVLATGTSDFGPYLVMEHLEGESVGSALGRVRRFDVDAALGVVAPVLDALEAAHAAAIIHRDLKPENVFLALEPRRDPRSRSLEPGARNVVVRLLDFGIAKVLAGPGPSPRTRTGVVYGTPDYLSPEQATGEAPLDGRSDLFAAGVILYELLTGVRPFRAATAIATAFRVVHAPTPTLAAAGFDGGAEIETLVQRLLEKDPGRRFQTAGEAAAAIARIAPDAARRSEALTRIVEAGRAERSLPRA